MFTQCVSIAICYIKVTTNLSAVLILYDIDKKGFLGKQGSFIFSSTNAASSSSMILKTDPKNVHPNPAC